MKKIFCILLTLAFIFFSIDAYCDVYTINGHKYTIVEEYGRYGVVDEAGKQIVPAKYKEVESLKCGAFRVTDFIGRKGCYSLNGKMIIPCEYSKVESWENAPNVFAATDLDVRFDIYRKHGTDIQLFEDKTLGIYAYQTSKGVQFVICHNDYSWGIYDSELNTIVKKGTFGMSAGCLLDSHNNPYYLMRRTNGSTALFNGAGTQLAELECCILRVVKDNRGRDYFEIPGRSAGRMEMNGAITQKPTYGEFPIQEFTVGSHTYVGWLDGRQHYGVKDSRGVQVLPYEYDNMQPMPNGIRVLKDGTWGFADENCRIVIPTGRFTNLWQEGDLIYAIDKNRNRGIYSLSGKCLISSEYGIAAGIMSSRVGTFTSVREPGGRHIALFKLDNDGTGHATKISEFQFSDFSGRFLKKGIFYPLDESGNMGIMDHTGKLIIPPSYTSIYYHADGKYFLAKDGPYCGVVNEDGWVVFEPMEFTNVKYDKTSDKFTATSSSRVCEFDRAGNLLSDSMNNSEYNKYIDLADNYFEAGQYRSALENYQKANGIKSSAGLYFNCGVCCYNMNNFSDALTNFYRCIDSKPSQRLLRRSYELIDSAKEQDRKNVAFNILGLALGTANLIMQARNSIRSSTYSQASSATFHNNQTDLTTPPPSLNPYVWANTKGRVIAAETKARFEREKQEFINNYRITYKQLYGREPTSMEEDAAYTQYIQEKMSMQAQANSLSSSSTSTNTDTHSHASTERQFKCPYCNGKGEILKTGDVAKFGTDGVGHKCKDCGEYVPYGSYHVHQVCYHCNGTGIAKY